MLRPTVEDEDVRKLIEVEDRLELIDLDVATHWSNLGFEAKFSNDDQEVYETLKHSMRFCKRGHAYMVRKRCETCHDMANKKYFAKQKVKREAVNT